MVFKKNLVFNTIRANAHKINQVEAGFYKSLALLKRETSQNLHVLKFSEERSSRTFTTTASVSEARSDSTNSLVVPVALRAYRNVDTQKVQILEENKGKAGVYRWINRDSGKSYIGSSVNLSIRFRSYFYVTYLKRSKMMISRAIIKHGLGAFSLEILEYCFRDQAINREQYYLDLLKSEYNILKIAGSWLGFKHSEKSIAKMKEKRLSEETKAKLSAINKGKKLSEETILKKKSFRHSDQTKEKLIAAWTDERKASVSVLKKGNQLSDETKAKMRAAWTEERKEKLSVRNNDKENLERLRKNRTKQAKKIEVVDILTTEKQVFPSISEAAGAIGVTPEAISNVFRRRKEVDFIVIKKRYQIKKISD